MNGFKIRIHGSVKMAEKRAVTGRALFVTPSAQAVNSSKSPVALTSLEKVFFTRSVEVNWPKLMRLYAQSLHRRMPTIPPRLMQRPVQTLSRLLCHQSSQLSHPLRLRHLRLTVRRLCYQQETCPLLPLSMPVQPRSLHPQWPQHLLRLLHLQYLRHLRLFLRLLSNRRTHRIHPIPSESCRASL